MTPVEFYYDAKGNLVTTKLDDNGNVIELSSEGEIYKVAEYDEYNNQIFYHDLSSNMKIKRKFNGYLYIKEYKDSYGNYWSDKIKIPFIFTKRNFLNNEKYNEFNEIIK